MLNEIDVIAPNFKKRLSGVTSTVVRLVPIQANSIGIVATGRGIPDHVPQIGIMKVLTMPRHGPSGARVWHARRNVEMIGGIALKFLFRKKLKLLFTSASQRQHTKFTKMLIRQMDQVISTSRKTATFLERESIVVLHGIDTGTFQPVPDKSDLRRKLGLPTSGNIIGCFGRIRKQKGTDVFVKAMMDVLRFHPDSIGVVMGRATSKDSSYEADLKRQVKAAGLEERILFLQEVPVWHMPMWYQALDLYVAPQRWEGFGLTPIEAMACAVPVIATRVGAFEELVIDGLTGALIPPSNSEEMSREIMTFLNDPKRLERAGGEAHKHVNKNFQIEKEAKELNTIYGRLLD